MLTPDIFHIDDVVTFNLYPAAVLGSGYQNAKVKAILDMATAALLGCDCAALHANVYSSLPSSVPDNPAAYAYVLFLLANGQTTIIGVPWIIDDTYVVQTVSTIQFTVENITPSDQNEILQALSGVGYKAVGMKVISSGS